jgi:antirestriction protein ArdC
MKKTASTYEKKDIYQEVTNNILAALENGDRPWEKPWIGGYIPTRVNGEKYHGINVLILWATSLIRGYKHNTWMTFKQSQALNASVKKGEKGTMIVYYNMVIKEKKNDTGDSEWQTIPVLKYYIVFNVDQIEGLPDRFYQVPEVISEEERNTNCDLFFKTIGADLRHGGTQAFYSPKNDSITLPDFTSFKSPEKYYATSAHEHVHWTNHKSRLDRSFGDYHKDNNSRAMEELVAELGSAFVCARLGLKPQVEDGHGPYIKSWIQVLKDDKKFIFKAAKHAQKACEYLCKAGGLEKEEAEEEETAIAA